MPRTEPTYSGVALLWARHLAGRAADRERRPSWAQEYYERLQRADCSPKVAIARGNHGRPTLAIEADCPGCGWVGGLVSWPLSTGAMARRCRDGCNQKEVAAGLEQRLKQRS
jgi:hypothetical protein